MLARLLDIDTALLTAHTVVRRFREGDGASLYDLVQDNHQRLYDYFPQTIRMVSSKEEAEFFVRQRLADWHLQQEYTFGIWHSKATELIGMVRVHELDWKLPDAELAFFIDQRYSRKGLMTEVLRALLNFSFNQLALEKLRLRTGMDNIAAQRLARKCDFRREGDLRGDFRKPSGEIADVMLFGLTRAEYLGV